MSDQTTKAFHEAIARAAVKLERNTLWEDVVRISWTLVLGYALFVGVCILLVSISRPA